MSPQVVQLLNNWSISIDSKIPALSVIAWAMEMEKAGDRALFDLLDWFASQSICTVGERALLDELRDKAILKVSNGSTKLQLGTHSKLFKTDFKIDITNLVRKEGL